MAKNNCWASHCTVSTAMSSTRAPNTQNLLLTHWNSVLNFIYLISNYPYLVCGNIFWKTCCSNMSHIYKISQLLIHFIDKCVLPLCWVRLKYTCSCYKYNHIIMNCAHVLYVSQITALVSLVSHCNPNIIKNTCVWISIYFE